MPVWLSILLGVLGGTGLLSILTRDLYDALKKRNKKYQEKSKEEKKKVLVEASTEAIQPILARRDAKLDGIMEKYDIRLAKIDNRMEVIENRLDSVEENMILTREGMQSELRHDIRNSCRRCIQQGYRTEDDVSEIDALHKSYEKVGLSNGLTNTLYDNFNKLPLVSNDYKPKTRTSTTTRKRKSPTAQLLNEGE